MGPVEEDPWTYHSTRTLFNTILIIGDLFGLTVVFLFLAWIIIYNSGFDWGTSQGLVSYHIFFMVLFMIFIQANTSLIYRILPGNPKFFNKIIHATFHFIVCFGMTVGLVAILQYHDIANQTNFYTLHSWVGIILIVAYYLQFVCGFFTYLYPGATIDVRVFTIPIHKVVGRTLFIFAVIAGVTGVMQEAIWSNPDYASLSENAMLLNFIGFFSAIFIGTMIYLLSDHVFRRRPIPFPVASGSSTGQTIFYGSTSSTRFIPTGSESIRETKEQILVY